MHNLGMGMIDIADHIHIQYLVDTLIQNKN